MTNSHITIACVIFAIVLVGCREEDGSSQTASDPTSFNPTSSDPAQEWCPSNTYVAEVSGMSGTARLGYEVGLDVIYVNGEITSQTAYYSFSGCELYRDIYTGMPTNNVCWVEVTGSYAGERFRAELHFYEMGSERGFMFTANAYEGAYSTEYNFVCQ